MAAAFLILRPEPGAAATAARARAMGAEAVVAPLFTVSTVPWNAPDSVEAVLLTSANGARHGGSQLSEFTHLPCFAVGEATAAAAEAAGFRHIRTGPSDGAALLEVAARGGARHLLHLCGRDHMPLDHPQLTIVRRIVYASEAAPALSEAALEALRSGAVALLHSPRAATLFAALIDASGFDREGIAAAAISPAAADAAGTGWKRLASAPLPRDEALLELAGKLCQTEGSETGKAYE